MKFIDLFAGIGGFHYGLRKAGNFECVWANEWNKYAGEIYQKRFPETKFYGGDIRTVDIDGIPEFDLLCGGFPCQAFSIAGKRKGFDDTRGTLFFEIARIIKTKRPKIVLLENVKGLLSHEAGRTFGRIIEVLGDLGYWVEWEVLNSKNFGVPQNRERVFIVGHLRGESGSQVFPFGTSDEKLNGENKMIELTQNVSDAQRIYSSDGIAKTLKGLGGGQGAKTGLYAVLTPNRENKRQHGRRFKNDEEPMFTLTGQDIHGVMHEQKIRRLTPKECERLQGFPDDWTEGLSDSQRYKCMGNAVTVNVVQAIGEKIMEEKE